MQSLSQFINLPLKYVQFKTIKEKDKDLLILELIFSDEGSLKTMVLLLDKEYTEGNFEELAERLTR
jgi:hypothetical protein